jgi:hypothetical protein
VIARTGLRRLSLSAAVLTAVFAGGCFDQPAAPGVQNPGDYAAGAPQPGQPGQPGYAPQPGYGAQPQPQPGYAPQPQPGYAPQPGYGPQPPQPGYAPQPGYGPQPQPGYAPQPGAGPMPQPGAGPMPQPGAMPPGVPSFPFPNPASPPPAPSPSPAAPGSAPAPGPAPAPAPAPTAPGGFPFPFPFPGGGGAPAPSQPSSGAATPIDPGLANAATVPLMAFSQQEAPGMQREGAVVAANFKEGQILEQAFQMLPGKCYTVLAVGAGPQQLDLTIVAVTPLPGSGVLAQTQGNGPNASLGGRGNCFKWNPPVPVGINAKYVIRAARGQGIAAGQLYSR